MKIGVCASPDKLPIIEDLGYDYIETTFSWLTSLNEAEFLQQTAFVERFSVSSEAFNLFFSGDVKLYAPDGNQDLILREISAYAEKGFSRASLWGGKVAVIGSGLARGIPEGMTRERTERQFARVLAVCGEAADKYGMKIVVEPLSYGESNYIHTVAEGAAAARLSNNSAVGVLVDFFHHHNNNEDPNTLPNYGDILYHVHYARPVDRLAPEEEDAPKLTALAALLKQCPKAERISLECIWKPDFESAVTSARPLMEIFKRS